MSNIQLRRVVRDSVQLYFAPLVGAYRGIRAELKRTDRQIVLRRTNELRRKSTTAH